MPFKIVPGSEEARRPFRITVGLREGYGDDGKVHPVEHAVRTAQRWMKSRAERKEPFLSGVITQGEVLYTQPRRNGVSSEREPVMLFTGEVIPIFTGHLDDDTVRALLNELAAELGEALGQEDVYVAYRDRVWALTSTEEGP